MDLVIKKLVNRGESLIMHDNIHYQVAVKI